MQKTRVFTVKASPDPLLNPPKAWHSSGRPSESLWEGLEELGELWEALAELREALGELWEGLYIQTPDQPPPAAVMLSGINCPKSGEPAWFVGLRGISVRVGRPWRA